MSLRNGQVGCQPLRPSGVEPAQPAAFTCVMGPGGYGAVAFGSAVKYENWCNWCGGCR